MNENNVKRLTDKIADEMFNNFDINIPSFEEAIMTYHDDNYEFKYFANTLCILPNNLDSIIKNGVLNLLRKKLFELDKMDRETFKKANELRHLFDYLNVLNKLSFKFEISERPDFIIQTKKGKIAVEHTDGNIDSSHVMDDFLLKSPDLQSAIGRNDKIGKRFDLLTRNGELIGIGEHDSRNQYYDMINSFIHVVEKKLGKKIINNDIYYKRVLLINAEFPMERSQKMFKKIAIELDKIDIDNFDEIAIISHESEGTRMGTYSIEKREMKITKPKK